MSKEEEAELEMNWQLGLKESVFADLDDNVVWMNENPCRFTYSFDKTTGILTATLVDYGQTADLDVRKFRLVEVK